MKWHISTLKLFTEANDRLNVPRSREHIDCSHLDGNITDLLESCTVSCRGGAVTGDHDDPSRRKRFHGFDDVLAATLAGDRRWRRRVLDCPYTQGKMMDSVIGISMQIMAVKSIPPFETNDTLDMDWVYKKRALKIKFEWKISRFDLNIKDQGGDGSDDCGI